MTQRLIALCSDRVPTAEGVRPGNGAFAAKTACSPERLISAEMFYSLQANGFALQLRNSLNPRQRDRAAGGQHLSTINRYYVLPVPAAILAASSC
jgi:hypothetical protein